MTARKLPIALGMVAAVLLQLLIAPVISIGWAVPNFVLAYTAALSFANREGANLLIAFFGGLAFDLTGSGPVGSMAFVCTVAMLLGFLLARTADSGGLAVTVLLIAVTCVACECIYGFILMACGVDVSLLDALVLRMLPCSLYDIVIATASYAVVSRLLLKDRDAGEMTIIEGRMD